MKAKIAQNNSQVSVGGITVKLGQDFIHEWIIWKVNPIVAYVTCSRCQIVFKWSVNFWLQVLVYDEWKIFQWMKFLFGLFSNSRKLSRQKFHNELACVFSAHLHKQECRLKSTTTNRWRHFGQLDQRKSSVLFPIQWFRKKVQILAFLHVICKRNVSCLLILWQTLQLSYLSPLC